MNDMEIRFLEEIRLAANGLKRVPFPTLCIAFGKVFPAFTGLDQRRRMHELLDTLRAHDEVTFPSGRKHYDRTTEPHMPRWIQLTSTPTPAARPSFDPATFPWSPDLRFAAKLKNLPQLEILRRVHVFLASGGDSRCMVPIKERSVELFGDEKKLDTIRKSALFRAGMLSLPLLRCYQVAPPLVWERGPQTTAAPVLVVENHSAFDSFVRWNKQQSAWAAVCYGNGESFEASAPSLRDVVGQVHWDGTLLYFGDIDPKGLLIPVLASKLLAETGLPRVAPHIGCYHQLLKQAVGKNDLPKIGRLKMPSEGAKWLGDDLAARVEEWFMQGIRIPQELVGYEQLMNDGIQFCGKNNPLHRARNLHLSTQRED